ncbi:hypothetical protein LOK46_30335 (plasmid) [Methylobacterium sp. NMS14P]|uniref:hypothetical protein n=1 Tax=Methylobacterium sp. NMS14P TaxID=2894310 RepID=UPI002359C6EE|nr:hypothetical protein [Methylobacterium sp. NMS14P]WCS28691.1 hypothetical protein LOK46_30335 [Methylobacterium sp. NMS14P]
MSSPLENILLEELRDLTVRVEVLQSTLGMTISLLADEQRVAIIKMLADNLKLVGSEDPRGVAGVAVKELIDLALLPPEVVQGRPANNHQ